MRPSLRSASLAALLVAALAGCAAIPGSGGVQIAEVAPSDDPVEFDFVPKAPVPDASPEQILRGFIDAATSPRGNYEIAREFLTPEFAGQWEPESRVTIDRLADRDLGTAEPAVDEESASTAMRVSSRPVAGLTATGQYETAESATPIDLPYSFERVDGQWRISQAPQGILIDESSFELVFAKHAIYFFDPGFRYLVPDLRWFAGRDSVQTSIVRALLAGPAEWLQPGVVTAFPDGLRLEPDAVPVTGRVASVDLVGSPVDDRLTLQRMQLQLTSSLNAVRSVSDVQLEVNGLVGDAPKLTAPRAPRVDSRSVVFDGEQFGYLAAAGGEIQTLPGLSDQVVQLGPTGAAVGVDAQSVAVRSEAGVSIVHRGDPAVLLDERDDLIVPAVDEHGIVWSVPADAPDELFWYDGDESGPVPVPWDAEQIAALDVSRDGTRLIVLLGTGAHTQFLVAAVQRDTDGRPVAIGPPVRLDSLDGEPADVAWIDGQTVASLTLGSGGAGTIVTQEVGGIAGRRSGPDDVVQIDGGNNRRELRALTADGSLDSQAGVGWQSRASDIRFVAAQQRVE